MTTWLVDYFSPCSSTYEEDRKDQKEIIREMSIESFVDTLGDKKIKEYIIDGLMKEFTFNETNIIIRKIKLLKLLKNGIKS